MKNFFWDWNGTLVDDVLVQWQSFNDTLRSHGGSVVSFERYRELYRHPIREMYQELGVDLVRHPFDIIAQEWHARYEAASDSLQLHHDALVTLATLQRGGARQMILSALPHCLLVAQVQRFGLENFFEHVRGMPNALAHSKVEQGRALAYELGARGEDIIVIGDSSHDADVARELNAQCVLVMRGNESRQRLEKHGYRVCEDFSHLLTLVHGE